ncbi:hypothetical protein A4A49_55027 [Nicotiana attenuata]|uniref:C2 domain-containing protein n=1 Tax=Nicotiana attenuata TaxID=49451 RepID=A0A1J6INN0_NICAT|nr:hypothetical protein A4A49_55027 [Nicotiana attenuata]
MNFSGRRFYRPRTPDDDDTTTSRRKYSNNFYYFDNNNNWEEEYVMKLLIRKTSNIYLHNNTFPYYSDGIYGTYRVIVSDERGREFTTSRRRGTPVPAWNEVLEISFSNLPIGQKLKLMVVRQNYYKNPTTGEDEIYYDDPGTSTGEVVVGRATISVPRIVQREEDQEIELVKLVGLDIRVAAIISLKTLLTKVRRRRSYIIE